MALKDYVIIDPSTPEGLEEKILQALHPGEERQRFNFTVTARYKPDEVNIRRAVSEEDRKFNFRIIQLNTKGDNFFVLLEEEETGELVRIETGGGLHFTTLG